MSMEVEVLQSNEIARRRRCPPCKDNVEAPCEFSENEFPSRAREALRRKQISNFNGRRNTSNNRKGIVIHVTSLYSASLHN